MEKVNLYIDSFKIKIREWLLRHAEGPHFKAWLAFISFIEAIFFPIPPDLLLIPILMHSTRWVYYAFLTTATSVFGGVVGYFIGMFLFDVVGEPIIRIYALEAQMEKVGTVFAQNAFLAIFISAFTPIPYKAFTLSAGFFNISLPVFIVASIIGRGLRFFIVAFFAQKFGRALGVLIFKYFNIASVLIALGIILFILLF